jgi:hypothetical protein
MMPALSLFALVLAFAWRVRQQERARRRRFGRKPPHASWFV